MPQNVRQVVLEFEAVISNLHKSSPNIRESLCSVRYRRVGVASIIFTQHISLLLFYQFLDFFTLQYFLQHLVNTEDWTSKLVSSTLIFCLTPRWGFYRMVMIDNLFMIDIISRTLYLGIFRLESLVARHLTGNKNSKIPFREFYWNFTVKCEL